MIFNKAFIKFDTNINFRFVKTKYDIYKTFGLGLLLEQKGRQLVYKSGLQLSRIIRLEKH